MESKKTSTYIVTDEEIRHSIKQRCQAIAEMNKPISLSRDQMGARPERQAWDHGHDCPQDCECKRYSNLV
jgi:hypothetical protein